MNSGCIRFIDVKRMLLRNGFILDRQSGGHVIFKRVNEHVAIPARGANRMILRRIMKSCDLADDPLFNKI